MPVRPASLRAGYPSLLVQRRVSPKKDTPAAPPCARKVRGRWLVAPTAHPCADGAMRALHRAHPAGISAIARRRRRGLVAARSCAPKQEQRDVLSRINCRSAPAALEPTCNTRNTQVGSRCAAPNPTGLAGKSKKPQCPSTTAFAGMMPALALFNPFRPRQAREEEARRGGAMDRAEFAVRAGMHGRQTPQRVCAVTRARCARDRGREGALLFGDFLLGKQEKATGPQGCGTNRHGRESVFAKPRTTSQMRNLGASRKSQPQGCGTNQQGRRWVVVQTSEPNQPSRFGAS